MTNETTQVAIIMGSDSDLPIVEAAFPILDSFGVTFTKNVMSAHRTPHDVMELIKNSEQNGCKVFIAAAGMAAHLAGAVAAHSTKPVIGIPIGISSFCYLILCSVTAYIRNITLSPNFMKDWISLLFTILLINSIQVIILDLVFLIKVDYTNYLINSGFTFLFYPIFFIIFNFINERISYQTND